MPALTEKNKTLIGLFLASIIRILSVLKPINIKVQKPMTHLSNIAELQNKNGHYLKDLEGNLTKGSIFIDMIRPLESKFCSLSVNLEQLSQKAYYPIWFLAETERNVFLWRNGHSIIDHSKFQFWISVEKLIDKRVKKLSDFDSDNIYHTPPLQNDDIQVNTQIEYLEGIKEKFLRIQDHAQALCIAGSKVSNETSQNHVLLPKIL